MSLDTKLWIAWVLCIGMAILFWSYWLSGVALGISIAGLTNSIHEIKEIYG